MKSPRAIKNRLYSLTAYAACQLEELDRNSPQWKVEHCDQIEEGDDFICNNIEYISRIDETKKVLRMLLNGYEGLWNDATDGTYGKCDDECYLKAKKLLAKIDKAGYSEIIHKKTV